VQNKVLEATAAGLPSVVTQAVFDGLPAEVRSTCTVADHREAFATAIIDMLRLSPEARRAKASVAGVGRLSWTEQLSPMVAILESASTA
jgi:hypothetical protein